MEYWIMKLYCDNAFEYNVLSIYQLGIVLIHFR